MNMRFPKNHEDKIKDAFINAHHGKNPVFVSQDLPQQVMKRIRKMKMDAPVSSYTILFEQLVWRMAPVALCAILILSVFILNTNLTPEYELAQLVGSDPISYDFMQFYGK
jgi:hypothetical protein